MSKFDEQNKDIEEMFEKIDQRRKDNEAIEMGNQSGKFEIIYEKVINQGLKSLTLDEKNIIATSKFQEKYPNVVLLREVFEKVVNHERLTPREQEVVKSSDFEKAYPEITAKIRNIQAQKKNEHTKASTQRTTKMKRKATAYLLVFAIGFGLGVGAAEPIKEGLDNVGDAVVELGANIKERIKNFGLSGDANGWLENYLMTRDGSLRAAQNDDDYLKEGFIDYLYEKGQDEVAKYVEENWKTVSKGLGE